MCPSLRPSIPTPQPPFPAPVLRSRLLAWYDVARRDLPWRAPPGQISAPWPVLVSEVMLQQTTVATVSARYADFLARYPDPATMAKAPLQDLLHAWQGLGYYRRARGLHACAQRLVAEHGGQVPGDLAALKALPGLGDYTAKAVASIAFGQAVVPIDANVRRVLGRLAATDDAAVIGELAEALASPERPQDLAQALMELGALVCTARRADCGRCPWQPACAAAAQGDPLRVAAPKTRKARPRRTAIAYLLRDRDGAILLRRRPDQGLLAGMIELPASPFAEPGEGIDPAAHAPVPAGWSALPGQVRHLFTHLDLEVRLVQARLDRPGAEVCPGFWTQPAQLGALALPTLTRKLLRHAGIEAPTARAATQSRQASAT